MDLRSSTTSHQHPASASNISWPPTQESSRLAQEIRGSSSQSGSPSGSPAEDDTTPRSAQPWLHVAKRSDWQQQDTSSNKLSAANHLGCSRSAQGHRRKRGCRGHGAQQRRAQQRSQQAAVSRDQRAAGRRSGSANSRAVAPANQARCKAIAAGSGSGGMTSSSSINTGGDGSDGSGGAPADSSTDSAVKSSDNSAGNHCGITDVLTALIQAQEHAVAGIAAAIQAQGEAAARTMAGLTAAVQQLAEQQTVMTKSVSNFLFAQRQSKQQQRQPQRQDANAGKTAQLRKKGEMEWDRFEGLARAKLVDVRAEREKQIQTRLDSQMQQQIQSERSSTNAAANRKCVESRLMEQVKAEFLNIESEVTEALRMEQEYEHCDYRRTKCKAMQTLISRYNSVKILEDTKEQEKGACRKYIFDQYGMVTSVFDFLVDPERFFSYDLVRSRDYSERPL